MSKICIITGSRATRGSIIHRRGMAKKKGGVGRHVTKNVPRFFSPNLHAHRVWVSELNVNAPPWSNLARVMRGGLRKIQNGIEV